MKQKYTIKRLVAIVLVGMFFIYGVFVLGRFDNIDKEEEDLASICDRDYDLALENDGNFEIVLNNTPEASDEKEREPYLEFFIAKYPYLEYVLSNVGTLSVYQLIDDIESYGYDLGGTNEKDYINQFIIDENALVTYEIIAKEGERFLGTIPVLLDGDNVKGIFLDDSLINREPNSSSPNLDDLFEQHTDELGEPQAAVVDQLNGGRSLNFYFDLGLAFIPNTSYKGNTVLILPIDKEVEVDIMREVDKGFYRTSIMRTCSLP